MNPSHRSSHQTNQSRSRTHTRYHTAASYNNADVGFAGITADSRRKPAWHILVPPTRSVHHTMAEGSSARYQGHFATTAALAIAIEALSRVQRHAQRSFGGFGPSPTPTTRLDEGSSRLKHALVVENAQSTELQADFRLPCSTPSHQPPPERAQNL